MAGSSAGSVAVDLVLNNRGFNNQVQNSVKSTENAFTTSFKKIGTVIAAAFAVEKVIEFGKTAVKAASDSQAAWTGLNSIVEGTGNNFDVAHKFLTKFTQDGLVGIEDAATAYKNLLARGYDTSQIESVMTALKDSAAFGRQSSYELSEAIVTATEGLKNENSILVDNAGVTKNVAKMWDEYAKSIGKTRNSLTQQEKIQAEVNGIMKETSFQTGDAATYTKTFGGQVQILKGAFSSMQIAIGKVVAPIVGLFIPAITAAINAVTAFFTRLQGVMSLFGLEFPDVVKKTSTAVSSLGGNVSDTVEQISETGAAAKKAAKEVNRAFGSVDEINVINTKKPDASSGASGGVDTGAGAAVPITPTVAEDSAISVAVSKTMQKVIDAFKMVGDALKPLGETIFAGLKWGYENILVPLGKWTIEDYLPAFFYAFSGALEALNGILIEVSPMLKGIWDNFLQPIAAWTGDVIVASLYALGDVFRWVGQNADLVVSAMSGIAAGWLTFKSLGILGAIAQFVGYAGKLAGVTGIFKSLGAAVMQLWTYFKAGGVVKVVTGAFTALKGALVAVAGALGISVGWVVAIIAAIAALVAGIIYLVKNWDKVKEVALNVWGKIKEIWGNIANWFNEKVIKPIQKFFSPLTEWFTKLFSSISATIKSVFEVIGGLAKGCWVLITHVWGIAATWFKDTIITPVQNFFANMWNSLKNAAKNAWEGIKTAFAPVTNWFKDKFAQAWAAVKNVFSIGGKIFDGIKNAIAGVFKTVVNGIIGGINKVIAVPFNAINKLLNKIRDVSVAGISPFKDFIKYNALSVPQIPLLAQGGWVGANNPQLAIVGDNKREGEIIAPESKIRDQVKQAIAEMGTMGQKFVMDLNLKIQTDDGRTIIKKINDVTIQDGYVSILV